MVRTFNGWTEVLLGCISLSCSFIIKFNFSMNLCRDEI